ncbi:hypothetical protein COCNU_scaffold001400G000040 [Cocos nucifera]|nr:hypothetical protein [Cocos nucifera]
MAAVEVWQAVESQQFGPPIEELVFEALIKRRIGGTTDQTAVERQAERLGKVLDVSKVLTWSLSSRPSAETLTNGKEIAYWRGMDVRCLTLPMTDDLTLVS